MQYYSNKQKVKNLIEKVIIPALKTKDLDYEKTILAIMNETATSRNVVEDVLKSFIGDIEEVRFLTLPKNKVISLIQELKEKESIIEKEINEACL